MEPVNPKKIFQASYHRDETDGTIWVYFGIILGWLKWLDDSNFVHLTGDETIRGNKTFLGFTNLNNFAVGDATTNLQTGNSFSLSQDNVHLAMRWLLPTIGKGPCITFLKDGNNVLKFQYWDGAVYGPGSTFEFNGVLRADMPPVADTDVVRLQDLGSSVGGSVLTTDYFV